MRSHGVCWLAGFHPSIFHVHACVRNQALQLRQTPCLGIPSTDVCDTVAPACVAVGTRGQSPGLLPDVRLLLCAWAVRASSGHALNLAGPWKAAQHARLVLPAVLAALPAITKHLTLDLTHVRYTCSR